MASLADTAAEVFRNFVTDGVPSSGANKPSKSEITALFTQIANAIAASTQGMASYATAADLPSDPVPTEGTQARVYADDTDTNNGVWIYKDGAWAFDTDYYEAVVSVVHPLVDKAEAWAESDTAPDPDDPTSKSAKTYAAGVASSAANILLDPRNELVAANPYLDSFDHFGGSGPKRAASGVESSATTPVLIAASGVTLNRRFDARHSPFLPGETIYFSHTFWSDGSAVPQMLVNWYDDASTSLASTTQFNGTATAGIQTITGSMTVPTPSEGHTIAFLGVRETGNCAREWIEMLAGYVATPKPTNPGLPPAYIAASAIVANLTADPLLSGDGVAGYTYNGTRLLSDPDNPLGGGSCGQEDSSALQVYIDLAQLPVQIGDTITWRALANFAEGSTSNSVGIGFVNSSGSSIGSGSVVANWDSGKETGTVDRWSTTVIPAGTVKIRLVAAGTGARKVMGFAVAEGLSRPNFLPASSGGSGSTGGSIVTRSPTKPLPFTIGKYDWHGVGVYGQSLGAGANATPALTTSQPFSNLSFAGGPRSGAELGGSTSSTAALIEVTTSSDGETICSQMANGAVQRALLGEGVDPADFVVFAFNGSRSNASVADLGKADANSTGYYADFLAQVQAAKDLADAASKTFAVLAVPYIQGEGDLSHTEDFDGTYSYYYDALKALASDLDTDIKAITGQSETVQMLMYQTALNSDVAATPTEGTITGAVQQAQLDLCLKEPNFHFVTPCWSFPPATTANSQVHLSNVGEAQMGAYFGRALHQLLIEQVEPQSLRPMGAVATGTKVTIRFEVPYKPLAIDTANLVSITDNGVALFDDTGKLTISDFETAANGTDLILTINRTLDSNPFVRIAEDYSVSGSPKQYTCGCNLRDSCPDTVTIDGTTYPTWHIAGHAKLPIYVL